MVRLFLSFVLHFCRRAGVVGLSRHGEEYWPRVERNTSDLIGA